MHLLRAQYTAPQKKFRAGGKALSARHAENSARIANAPQPEYLATLVVSFPLGEARFLSALELKRTVFRGAQF